MGIVDKLLFSSFVPPVAKLIDSYNNQQFADIAWYSVAGSGCRSLILFNDHFTNKRHEKKDGEAFASDERQKCRSFHRS
jgi:hypothetical protein